MTLAAPMSWPEAALWMTFFVAVCVGWCALIWLLAHSDSVAAGSVRSESPTWKYETTTTTRPVDDPKGAA